MNMAFKPLSWALLGSLAAGMAAAQESPSASPPAASAPSATSAGASAKAAKSTAQIDAGEPRANTSPTVSPTPATPVATPAARTPPRSAIASRPGGTGQKAPGSGDRLDLGTATVTGDREQPKVMYIVPWKKSDIGDLSGKPMNSLLDEALSPVDRDEFKREVAYFDAVNAAPQNGASNTQAKQGEK